MKQFNSSLCTYQVAVSGLGMNIGSYGAEVLRGAIRSVHEGQYEACQALNMTAWQRARRIILPQALLAAIPPVTNLLIELLKNTSPVSLITLSDMAFRARHLDQATLMTLEIFGLALLIYFVFALIINSSMRAVERRLGRGLLRGGLSGITSTGSSPAPSCHACWLLRSRPSASPWPAFTAPSCSDCSSP